MVGILLGMAWTFIGAVALLFGLMLLNDASHAMAKEEPEEQQSPRATSRTALRGKRQTSTNVRASSKYGSRDSYER